MTHTPTAPAGSRTGPRPQRARILDELRHDPYESRRKPAEPTVCSECGAVFTRGRWAWDVAPPGARSTRCAACQRAHDKLPAGWLTLEGPFVAAHRDELLAIVSNVEAREKAEHPMHRVLAIEQHADRVVVATSDVHLPKRIGDALVRAHRGELDVVYGDAEYAVRAHWRG